MKKIQGVAALCPGIASSSSLLCLNLENKGLTAVGCAPLADALNKNSSLQELILARNTFGQQGLATLGGGGCALATLKVLSLTECGLSGTDSATVLSTLLSTSSTLQVLRLEENTGIDAAFINAMSVGLGATNSLRELHLRGCSQLQSQGITTLFQNLPTTLTHLDISGTGAGPEGLTAAAAAVIEHSSGGGAVNLGCLVACGCGGDDPSLAALISSLSGTLHLDFSGNSVGHLTITAIAGHARLRAVCLHDCKLGVEGGDALCEQILINANGNSFIDLAELDISANGLETPQLVNILNALESTAVAAADATTANDDKMCCCLINLKQLVIAANPGAMEIEVTEAIERVQSVRPELDVVRRSADTGERDNNH